MLEDVLNEVMPEQPINEGAPRVALCEQLPPSILTSIRDVCAIGHKFRILFLKVSQRPVAFLFRGHFVREMLLAICPDLASESYKGVRCFL